jgi:glycosyltransferase involved in cell wall biosynthesis
MGIPGDAPVIGVVARLSPSKGHGYFLTAASMVRANFSTAQFIIAGCGDHLKELQILARNLNIADCVHFAGFRTDIPKVIASFDVLVLPSIGCDASSGAIKEGMAMTKPVIATDIGGAREIIGDQETGIIVPPADAKAIAGAIIGLLKDRAYGKALGENARKHVCASFTDTILAESIEQVYFGLIANRHAGICN